MKLNEYHEPEPVSSDWVDKAEQFGVDRAYAHDVVGAVLSFCRLRHGMAPLDDDYVSFLVARSAYVANGDVLTADRAECIRSGSSVKERMLLRALASSGDPSTLFDTYRMKLVLPQNSDLYSGGYVLSANLKKISAEPHENISFLWLSLFRRVAEGIADWRKGNAGLQGVIIRTGYEKDAYPDDVKELLVSTIRKVEQKRGLEPVDLIWAR